MGFETDLLEGLAELLDAEDLGTWRSSGAYTASETGIVLDTVPAAPDSVITLSDYAVDDDPSLSDSVLGVQVRTRMAGQGPRPVKDLDGAIFDLLHGRRDLVVGGVHVVQIQRRSSTSMGQDANRRWSRSSNFYFDLWRPSPHRI